MVRQRRRKGCRKLTALWEPVVCQNYLMTARNPGLCNSLEILSALSMRNVFPSLRGSRIGQEVKEGEGLVNRPAKYQPVQHVRG